MYQANTNLNTGSNIDSAAYSGKYADIMYLPKPKLKRKMETAHRAKIFAPFDALKGFKESVTETADFTENSWKYETEQVVIC